jgi:hypothetical protein
MVLTRKLVADVGPYMRYEPIAEFLLKSAAAQLDYQYLSRGIPIERVDTHSLLC